MNICAPLRTVPPATSTAFLLSLAVHAGMLLWLGPLRAELPRIGVFPPTEILLVSEPAPPTAAPKPVSLPIATVARTAALHPAEAPAAEPEKTERANAAPENSAADKNAEPLVESRYDVAALNNPKPPYPLAARRNGMEGKVVLRAHVLENGHCAEVKLLTSSGHGLLDNSALATVKQWRFVPAARSGVAVASWVEVPITFRLRDDLARN